MQTNNTENPAYLFVSPPGGERFAIELEANNSVFVGTGPNCRVVLQGSSVEQIHCMFWLSEKRVLRVQDWNTEIGTLVNGQPVSAETIVSSGDELEVDGNRIVPVLTQLDHQKISSLLGNQEMLASMAETLQPESMAAESQEPEPPQTEQEPEQFTYDAMAELDGEVDVNDELASPYDDVADDFDESAFGHSQLVDSQVVESQNEELELLRMEVDELRYELAQRDSQLTSFEEGAEEIEPIAVDNDQTIQLVNRLEDLLEELQTSDERVRGLEELLTASDQATQHEREERQQLESWVMEIEQRLSQRESESSAEMDRLVNRLNESKAQHQHAAIQLKKVLQSKGAGQGGIPNEVVNKLRDQIEDLQQRLADSQSENDKLLQASPGDGTSVELQQMEQKLLQVQVETSRERAEMSRQRAELEKLKDQLESKLSSAKTMGNADTRVQAIRQHLREIHDEEQLAIEEKRQRSLSGRISRLLSRVSS